MFRFFSQIAKAAVRVFSPADAELVKVGYQPITGDVNKRRKFGFRRGSGQPKEMNR